MDTLVREGLHSWISAEHLDDEAIRRYRDAFMSHPARLVSIENFLVPEVAERLSRFLAQEAILSPFYGLYREDGSTETVERDEWLQAPESARFHRFDMLSGLDPAHGLSENTMTYVSFRGALQGEGFSAFFEQVTGLELGLSTEIVAHRMGEGDFLRPHDDNSETRRLATVFYLAPGWETPHGGSLNVIGHDDASYQVGAAFNSVVAFDVTAHKAHYVDMVSSGARISIGGWYPDA